MLPIRTGTLIMLVVALLFGGLAVFIAKVWLANQQETAAPAVVAPPKIETSTIVVAQKDLHFGEPIVPEVLTEVPWPKESRPEGAFSTIADLQKDGRRVVLTPIGPNEPILAWKISGPGSRASLSALVKEGMRAVTIRVNDTSSVAGFVLPGDRVDVLYTRDRGNGSGATIDVLFQNVRVLAINQNADEKKGDPIDGRVATLELTPVDAQKLSLAESTGALTFTLRAAGSLDTAPNDPISEGQLLSDTTFYQASKDAKPSAQDDELKRRMDTLEAKLSQAEADKAQQAVSDAKPAVVPTTGKNNPTSAEVMVYRGLQGSSATVPLDATP